VESGIATLMEERERDPRRGIVSRLLPRPAESRAEADPNAYFVTKAFEAWNESGPEGAAAWLATEVELIDPPRWPGSSTWVGRQAAVVRLEEVSRELRASKAEILETKTLAGKVLVSFGLRSDPHPAMSLDFSALIEVEDDEIARVQVFVDKGEALRALECTRLADR
jgi:ketosteroid isomerase-like protein